MTWQRWPTSSCKWKVEINIVSSKQQHAHLVCVDMLNASAPSNGLKTALDGKLGVADKYSDADTTALVTSLINGADNSNVLYTTVEDIKSRVETLEDAVADDCGSHCKAGEFVSQACTADQPTTCSSCPANTFSLGGLPNTCLQCTVCPAGFFVVAGCTPASDTVCRRCDECTDGVSFESQACGGTQNRVCSTCTACASTQFASTTCSVTANAECQDCTVCSGDFEDSVSCTATTDAECRFRAVGFRAVMPASKLNLGTGNGDIDNWITSHPGVINSLFSTVGTSLGSTTFTVPEDGFYFSALNVRMDSINSVYVRAMVTLDDVYSPNEGLHVMKGNINANYYTLR